MTWHLFLSKIQFHLHLKVLPPRVIFFLGLSLEVPVCWRLSWITPRPLPQMTEPSTLSNEVTVSLYAVQPVGRCLVLANKLDTPLLAVAHSFFHCLGLGGPLSKSIGQNASMTFTPSPWYQCYHPYNSHQCIFYTLINNSSLLHASIA